MDKKFLFSLFKCKLCKDLITQKYINHNYQLIIIQFLYFLVPTQILF